MRACPSFLCNKQAGNRVIKSNTKTVTKSCTIYMNTEFKIVYYTQIELVTVNINTILFS